MKNQMKINNQNTRASFVPNSFDPEKRTVDITWTTGAKVVRYSWTEGRYFEELSLQKSHVNLDRLNRGAPVLNNHSSYSLKDTIGVVERAWIKNKEGGATVRLSDREDIQGIVRDIENGIIRNISVGYSVQKYEDVSKKGDETKTFRAVEWTPMELSFVNIPADPESQVRSQENEAYEVSIVRNDNINNNDNLEEGQMTEEERKAQEAKEALERKMKADADADAKLKADAERKAAEGKGQDDEITRQKEIRNLVKSVGLDEEISTRLIDEKKSTAEANVEIVRLLAEKNEKNKTVAINTVEVNEVDNQKSRKEACSNAIEHLYGVERPALIEGAREYCGFDILDIARRFMASEGLDVRNMSKADIAKIAIGANPSGMQRTHTSSDFPFLLADVTNKTLQKEYAEARQTHSPFVSERAPVSDFKTLQSTKFGDAPVLEEVNEKGEYKEGSISEGKEEYVIKKYGKMISVSERLLMNDDLNAMLKLASKFGRRSKELESDICWAIITANAAMGDGTTLFHANHGNLAGSGAVFDVGTVGAGRKAMRSQLGLDGAKIEVRPQYLVVPAALETLAEQFLGAIVAATDSTVNPFKSLKMISETRLDDDSATAWYLFGDKGQSEMVESVKMRGYETPQISTKLAFEDDSMKMKVKYFFAAKALDWVGFYKNAGA